MSTTKCLLLVLLVWPAVLAYWSGPVRAGDPDPELGLTESSASTASLVPDPTAACRKPRRSRARFLELCRRQPSLLREVSKGVSLATAECQHQFAGRRWNCTTARRSLRKILMREFRETSFVSALMAAGVTYAVTRACSTGDLLQCGCDRHFKGTRYALDGAGRGGSPRRRGPSDAAAGPPPSRRLEQDAVHGTVDSLDGDWVWGGCGDNVQFGARKSRAFLDTPYRRRTGLHSLVRMHNHAAGRLAVRQHMRRGCKCHGLSGSCTLRTCWWRMPPFREVGDRLKDRFDAAVHVVPTNDGRGSFSPESPESSAPPRRQDLVYAEDSPDFCRRDARLGSLGTQGRLCNATAHGTEGCDLLCCGRGHDTRVQRTQANCRCRFVWCCEVRCSACEERRMVHSCR